MTDRDYAIKSMKEITFQMASHAQDYLEVTMERHYTDIKELMTSYQKLILENQIVLEELDMECQEKINEDMAYALSYLSIYNNQLNVPKMHREMNNLMIIYGLSDMIYRGMTLVKFYAPNGVMLSEILHSCFCSHYNKTDVEVQQELGVGRTSFYKMKKQALGYLGFYFYPFTFEFLGLDAKDAVSESDLEQALMDHLQEFMLELGQGFCFEARQKRIVIDDKYYFIDLVFYNRLLHCNVIIELKNDEFKHEDLGQLNAYVGYYKKNEMMAGDNPPVGILLCTDKGSQMVEYALSGMDNQLFVSTYMLHLPDKKKLEEFMLKEMAEMGMDV